MVKTLRSTLAVVGAVAVAALLATPAPAIAARAGGAAHELAADGSPLALRSVALGQVDRDLVLTVRFRAAITPAQFSSDSARLCATLTRDPKPAVRLCAEGQKNAWVLRSGSRVVLGAIAHPRAGTLRIRVAPDDLGLTPGAVGWSVKATPASCATAASAQSGGVTPTTGGAPAPPAPPVTSCASRAPRKSGSYAGRVWRAIVTGCARHGAGQVTHGPSDKRVALTYDDGPSPYTTPLLRTLERLNVPATFFMLGQQVRGHEGLLRRMMADGHELANHSWSHANLGGGGPGATSEIERTNAAIHRATGFSPCLFRPPYGSTGPDLVSRANALGLTSVIWTADPFDWKTPGTDAIVARVLAQTHAGGIVLEHDGGGNRSQTLAAAPLIIAALRGRGYRFVTVSNLLGYREQVELRR